MSDSRTTDRMKIAAAAKELRYTYMFKERTINGSIDYKVRKSERIAANMLKAAGVIENIPEELWK